VISVSDNYFSSQDNALMPNRGINMGDGWETRRSRLPGNKEWILIKLARAGIVNKIEVDTNHFKGNFPESVRMEGCFGVFSGVFAGVISIGRNRVERVVIENSIRST
jgi:allantoicase